MAAPGYQVRVFTSARGYEDATVQYPPPRKSARRVKSGDFPSDHLARNRCCSACWGRRAFNCSPSWQDYSRAKVDGIFFSTSPPLVGVIASILSVIRRVPIAYWAMDLNPDQLIAMGKLKPTAAPPPGCLRPRIRLILRRSSLVIVLDRFMADRLEKRMPLRDKMLVMPPWSHDEHFASFDLTSVAGESVSCPPWPGRKICGHVQRQS